MVKRPRRKTHFWKGDRDPGREGLFYIECQEKAALGKMSSGQRQQGVSSGNVWGRALHPRL